MYKIILVSCLALAVAPAEVSRNDDYIKLNNYQNQRIIDDYDIKLAHFEELFSGRVEAAVVQSELVTAALIQSDERLNPFVLLGDYFKQCVVKYRSSVPSVLVTQKAMATCELEATKQLNVLSSTPRNTRNALDNFFKNSYEKNLKDCGEEYEHTSTDYTLCVTSVTALANSFTIANKKSFETELEAAICTANANIKALLGCTFNEQTRVITLISEANVLIKQCLEGKDECRPCEEYTCSEKYDLQVSDSTETIKNPFFGLKNHTGCLLLNAK